MKMNLFPAVGAAVVLLVAGCVSPPPPGVERGPHGTIAYDVLVEASDPGAKIEVNGNLVGNTPLHLKIFGNRNGTFHDFGSYYYTLRAYPVTTNQFQQIRVYGTGRDYTRQDMIPQHIYFDMNENVPVQVPADPPQYYRYYEPYPYPYYPYPYPYYYGPEFRFYIGPGYHHRR